MKKQMKKPKKINWPIIIAVIIIALILLIVISNKLTPSDNEKEVEKQQIPDSEYTDLQTSSDDLASIDETLELLD
ncbi:hypothetical protein HYW75_03665 [Candidatus Pacearchaeota archaeon]|nr:hypothetical protein [Candidatus Pacearchaeota archaeon]